MTNEDYIASQKAHEEAVVQSGRAFDPRGGKCDNCGKYRSLRDGVCHECEQAERDASIIVDENGEEWTPGGLSVMTKSELRKARKEAVANGQPLTGELTVTRSGYVLQHPGVVAKRIIRESRHERYASRAEQHARYIDCGPANWDDR